MASFSRRSVLEHGAIAAFLGHSSNALAASSSKRTGMRLGVNLAGAEFKMIGNRWSWPKTANLDYYLDKGFNIFRIPFKWQRLQPALNGELDEDALAGLDQLVARMTAAGAIAVLDAHNFGRREQIIINEGPDPEVTASHFADFWRRMALRYKSNPLVWYNMMNEPNNQSALSNIGAQNAACLAIRDAGAKSKVLFSGTAWSGAYSWTRTGNALAMLKVHDPGDNYAFDAHQYLDKKKGGSSLEATPGIGAHILDDITRWATAHRKQIFLGEFATGPSPASLIELKALLDYMHQRPAIFIGATYFAGGGTWGRKMGSSDPVDGIDKPQTLLMERYL